jgi:periplasmic protein TonB
MKENRNDFWIKFFSKTDTQPSLFHYIKEKPDPGVFEDMDWSFLTHPIHAIKEGWNSPRTKPSLFHYINEEQKTHLTFKELCSDIFTEFRNPLFIPSVFCDPEGLVLERVQGRTRKWEASMVSVVIHVLVLVFLFILVTKPPIVASPPDEDKSVMVLPRTFTSHRADGKKGGGGGGGGKDELTQPSPGGLADGHKNQIVPPQLDIPKVLLPSDEPMQDTPSIQTPFDILQDHSIDPGDITAPPTAVRSNGNGTGGGMGSGKGTGQGSGEGSGAGKGKGSGIGNKWGDGIGDDVGSGVYSPENLEKEPRALIQPLPPYTEDARKARIEGVVLLQAIIRKDGTVDSFKVLKGLGHGLDDSAINTISTKWRFSPGTFKGNPVNVIANIEVRFRMF